MRYAIGTGSLEGAPHIHRASLRHKGLTESELDRIEKALPTMLDVRGAFARGQITDETLTRLGVTQAEREKPGFTALPFLGFTDEQIDAGERGDLRQPDGRGRAGAARRAPARCSTARIAAARTARASSSRWATCA